MFTYFSHLFMPAVYINLDVTFCVQSATVVLKTVESLFPLLRVLVHFQNCGKRRYNELMIGLASNKSENQEAS